MEHQDDGAAPATKPITTTTTTTTTIMTTTNNGVQVQPLSVEEIIEQSIGRLTLCQIIQAILVSFMMLFDVQPILISVFTDKQPTWHCTGSTNTSSCRPNTNLCSLSKSEWGWDSGNVHTSIVSEWDLECVSSFIKGLPATSFFLGCLVGGFVLAALGDSSLGRKNLLCMSSLLMSVAALGCAFAPNIWVYSVLRFLSGVGRATIGSCVLVLLTERVVKQWRNQMLIGALGPATFGMLTLTGIAYQARHSSWRVIYIWTSIPGIAWSVICYFFLLDSPRWLFMRGQNADAMAVLRRLGSSTQIIPGSSNIIIDDKVPNNSNPFISLKILMSKRWAVKQLIACTMVVFGIGITYYGTLLSVGNLGFNIYLTTIFSALLSFVSYVLTYFYWVQKFNRRSSVLWLCVISGAASIILSVVGKRNEVVIVGLDLVSMFCSIMAYSIIVVYMVELFPTCVRSSATSVIRQALTLGTIFVPIMVLKGGKNLVFSYGVFGSVIFLVGFLVLCLPETRGKPLCDSMEEQELRDKKKGELVPSRLN